ncbi:MAG: ribonuclease P protein component [Opitutales bacterium]|nr:ribonuclease P protein component [Opitutales bacterium]
MRESARQRLRKSSDFARVRTDGRKAECGVFSVQICLRTPDEQPPLRRFGVIASRRIGGAVQRNRAKRLMREVFRARREVLPESCDVVIVARARIFDFPLETLEKRFTGAANKLRQQLKA